jgi:hypothetical protein
MNLLLSLPELRFSLSKMRIDITQSINTCKDHRDKVIIARGYRMEVMRKDMGLREPRKQKDMTSEKLGVGFNSGWDDDGDVNYE